VTFKWPYGGSYKVELSGSFNGWKRIPMQVEDSVWVASVLLSPGTYFYKFILNGHRWCFDMATPHVEDEQGNINNVVQVQ